MLAAALLMVLTLLLIGTLPNWRYTRHWGWGWWPTGGLGLALVLVLVLMLQGRI